MELCLRGNGLLGNRRFRVQLCLLMFLLTRCAFPGDWPTFAHDAQRTGWAFEEDTLSPGNAAQLELKWKIQLKNEPKALTALTTPVVATGVETREGIRTVVYVGGSSNHLFAIDAATGKLMWSQTFDTDSKPINPDFWLCPQGINATPVIDESTRMIYEIATDGKLFGLDLATGVVRFGPIQFVPPFSKNWSLNLSGGTVYTSISQGCGGAPSGIYSMDIRNPMHPVIDELLVAKDGGGVWGRGGPVIGLDHRIFTADGDGIFDPSSGSFGSSVVAATLGDLNLADYFTPDNYAYLTQYDLDFGSGSAVWFAWKNYNLICVGGKEGVLYMLDADSLGSKDHHTPLYRTPRLANDAVSFEGEGIWGAPSMWQDLPKGETWIYVPVSGPASKEAPQFPTVNGDHPHGCIMAFQVVRDSGSGKPILRPAWISGDLDLPEPVAIANGVVFALSTGENPNQVVPAAAVINQGYKGLLSNAQRTQNTRHAILYALDAHTGKKLYNSGNIITSWTHFTGLAVAEGRVYAVDHDSHVYCFGLKDEAK
jgi:outer membrane protein assembly factor BamB